MMLILTCFDRILTSVLEHAKHLFGILIILASSRRPWHHQQPPPLLETT